MSQKVQAELSSHMGTLHVPRQRRDALGAGPSSWGGNPGRRRRAGATGCTLMLPKRQGPGGGPRDLLAAGGARAGRAPRELGFQGSGAQDPLPAGFAGFHDQAQRPSISLCAERRTRQHRQAECRDRLRQPKPTRETADAEALLGFSPAHRSRERTYRTPDDAVTWNADRCRMRSGHGSENLNCCRRPTTSLVLRHGKPVVSMIRNLKRKPRHVLDWLNLGRNM